MMVSDFAKTIRADSSKGDRYLWGWTHPDLDPKSDPLKFLVTSDYEDRGGPFYDALRKGLDEAEFLAEMHRLYPNLVNIRVGQEIDAAAGFPIRFVQAVCRRV
jgi:hypothetical protein